MENIRKFRKITKVKIVSNEIFCEFYGLLLGDGCISKYKNDKKVNKFAIFIVCNKKLDSDYLKDWKNKLEKEYSLKSSYYEDKHENYCRLSIYNKDLCLQLNKKYAVPIGLKYRKLKLSSRILKLPWRLKKYVFRGLLDTDGLVFARKDENYRLPHISITSVNPKFLIEMKEILRKRGYPAYINGEDIRIRGIKHFIRWFEDIGSSNPRNLKRYEYFKKYEYLPTQSSGLVG